jgi:hypothetical protein
MTELPRWTVRLNATRPTPDYHDLIAIVAQHYHTYVSAENFLAPYNARERSKSFYTPPDRETLKQVVKQGGMNNASYFALLNGLIKFCETTKGMRALAAPHPSTIHSIQVPQPAFELVETAQDCTMGTHQLTVPGAEPIYLKGVRNPESIRFVIVRPKLSQLGTPSAKEWEALLFNQNYGYVPNWVDSTLNTRWAGKF